MLTERTAEGEHSPKRKWVVSDMIISKIGIIQYVYYCILLFYNTPWIIQRLRGKVFNKLVIYH